MKKNLLTIAFSFLSILAFSQLELISSHSNFDGGLKGLEGSVDIFSSSDGKFIYTLATDSKAICVFECNLTDSTLSYMTTYYMSDIGLTGVEFFAMSPDEDYVYVSSFTNDKIALYSRNSTSGLLSYVESYTNNTSGISGMRTPGRVVFSADGTSAYVPSYFDNTLLVFSRNTTTGALTYLEKHVDGSGGVNYLDYVMSIVVSPDDEYVYAAAHDDDAITIFSRNTTTGALTYVKELVDGVGGLDGIRFVEFMLLTPDGKHLYTCSNTSTNLTVFSRNSSTGDLTFVQNFDEGSVFELNSPNEIKLSNDGSHLFVSDIGNDGIFVFTRNASNGTISHQSLHTSYYTSNPSLTGITNINVNAVNNSLYVVDRFKDVIRRYYLNASHELVHKQSFVHGQGGKYGIANPTHIIEDWDRRNVYLCSSEGAATTFRRHGTDSVEYLSCVHSDSNNVNAMAELYNIQISPDNQRIYSNGDLGLVDFSVTGQGDENLQLERTLSAHTSGLEELFGGDNMRLSPDGNHLYICSGSSNFAVIGFNTESDTLVLQQQHTTDTLWGAGKLEMAPNGKFVTVSAEFDKLVSFSRNETTGELNLVDYLANGQDGVSGLDGIYDLEISMDSRFLYTTSTWDNMFHIYSIDENTGALTLSEAISPDTLGGNTCTYYTKMEISSDNHFLLVKSNVNDLKIFRRDIQTGRLSFIKDVESFNYGTFTLSRDGKLLYAGKSNNLSVFRVDADAALLELGIDIIAVDGDTVWLELAEGFTDIEWSTGETEHSIAVTETGTYFVTVTDEFSATASDTIYIEFIDDGSGPGDDDDTDPGDCSETATCEESGIEELRPDNLKIYPNPTTDKVIIQNLRKDGVVRYRLLNSVGASIIDEKGVYGDQLELILPSARGIYFLEFITNDGVKSVYKVLKI